LNVIICEDKLNDANTLRLYISQFFSEINCPINITVYENGDSFLKDYKAGKIKELKIAFIDIYLLGTNGIDVARKIRESDKEMAIVFTTISTSHALDGYALDAMQYLLKPVDYHKVAAILNKCLKMFSESIRFIEVISDRLAVKVWLKDILYIEAFDKTVLIHTNSKTIKSYLSLSELDKQLVDSTFLKTHRSFIVNMRHIEDVGKNDFVLSNGIKVPIGRDNKTGVKQVFEDYLFAKTRGW
jgi:DNA-binding LytR/AlgR family response regulator